MESGLLQECCIQPWTSLDFFQKVKVVFVPLIFGIITSMVLTYVWGYSEWCFLYIPVLCFASFWLLLLSIRWCFKMAGLEDRGDGNYVPKDAAREYKRNHYPEQVPSTMIAAKGHGWGTDGAVVAPAPMEAPELEEYHRLG